MRAGIRFALVAVLAALAGAASLAGPAIGASARATKSAPLSISVSGNHLVNGSGQTIRLLGVDRPWTEYACQQGWADSSGSIDSADAAAIAAWDADAVRIPLNEDCWLGINRQPSFGTRAG